jgi:NDP-sugar pyrophosphorylase family protein
MKAFILAGGKGKRLFPYTTNFPKPLMPVGEKPILEILLKQLKKNGFTEAILSTGHLEELIRAYFQDGSKFGIRLTYSKEEEPLGTAGPLRLVQDKLTETFLVINGDVISDLDFNMFREFHKQKQDIATIALSQRTVDIDYGVVQLKQDGTYDHWQEKPKIQYFVSTGIYLLEPEALHYLPKEGAFTMPELIEQLRQEHKNVSGYIHPGYWLDIGRPDDYEKACNEIGNIKNI